MKEDVSSQQAPGKGGLRLAVWLPVILFFALSAVFLVQLMRGGGSDVVPSALIGKPAPSQSLPPVEGLQANGVQLPGLDPAIFAGKVTVVNVWASWCAPCREEHPVLMAMARDPRFQLVGINYKDKAENALRFLGQLGNPFVAVGADSRGRAAIEWGVYGVPETYVVGPDSTIRYKHVGPLTPQIVAQSLIAEVEKAAK